MTERGSGNGAAAGRPRPSPQERQRQRAAVEDPAVILAAAARLLEARARSVHEVRRRLTQAGYQPALVDGVVQRLLELGMLDDEAFARSWVHSRDRSRPRGARVLALELRRMGIAPETIESVLAERAGEAGPDADGNAAGGQAPVFGQLRARQDLAAGGERADAAGARRLLERHAAALARVSDPRKRQQRAYALLARSGFEPDLVGRLVREMAAGAGRDADDHDADTEDGRGDPA